VRERVHVAAGVRAFRNFARFGMQRVRRERMRIDGSCKHTRAQRDCQCDKECETN